MKKNIFKIILTVILIFIFSSVYTKKKQLTWKQANELQTCTYFPAGGLDTEGVAVNFANWYLDLLVALTYFRDPFIFIKPTHSGAVNFRKVYLLLAACCLSDLEVGLWCQVFNQSFSLCHSV